MPKKVLIVDDITSNRLILKEMLRRDYDIIEAGGGEEALAILHDGCSEISAVLLDISMPDIDGFEVLRRVRSKAMFASLPIIMITGSEDEKTRTKSLTLGANDFVMKPYSSEIIKHCLRNNIAFSEAAATVSAMQRDRLTGLYNRETFFEKTADMVSVKEPAHYIMACIDIDRFKVINDRYGTATGDASLRHVAGVFRENLNPLGGICGRISADHFAAVYPVSCTEGDILDKIRAEASAVEGVTSPLTFSTGRYIIDDISLSPAAMYDRAMLASLAVKGRFDNKIAYYDETMRENLIREQMIVSEMKDALENRRFAVWYQPQYNHSTGAMIGAEALVRWVHPEKGTISPAEFIPIFEQNGFIYSLDKYVWEEVCRNLRKWLDEGRNPLPVSVNVSRYDILYSDITETIGSLVKKYELPIELLRLEITESAFAENGKQIVSVVKELIALGFTVEIDDFGSGYSSLNTLKDVPAQIIKLDMKFLETGDDTQRGGNIVESVVRMAKWLGVAVIAEGVETLEQADFLRSIGCNFMQGYLYAKPMPVDKYEEHCRGIGKEERLPVLETVENLDNNAFWDPNSIDTLIFNSYVGGACIYEYHNEKIEMLRATEKFAHLFGADKTVEDVLKLKWEKYLDTDNAKKLGSALRESAETKKEISGEYIFKGIPGCEPEIYLRSTMRVIAAAGARFLVYCINENITAQRKSEKQERETMRRLQTMISDMPGGYARIKVNADNTLTHIYFNDTYCALRDMSREETLEAEKSDAISSVHPEDRPQVKKTVFESLFNGEPTNLKYRLRCGGGEYKWFSVFMRQTLEENGERVINAYYTDISAQITEDEARNKLLDNLPGGAGLYSYSEGKISAVYLNKSYWELVGRRRDDYKEIMPLDSVHPDDIPVLLRDLSDALEQNRDVVCDIRLLHETDGYCPVHLVGRIVPSGKEKYLVFVNFSRISGDSVSYHDMLPLLLSTIMESSTDLVFAKDKNFRYVCCSPAFAKFTRQASEADVIGKTDYDFWTKAEADRFRNDDERLFKGGVPLIDFIEPIPSDDGIRHYCSTSKYILRDSTGAVIGLYGVGRDITETMATKSRLELLANNIPGGMAVYEGKLDRLDKIKITYFSDGFCRLFGYSREEYTKLSKINPLGLVFPTDIGGMYEKVTALVKDGVPMDYIYRAKIGDGSFKWINVRAVMGEPNGDDLTVNAVFFDVTDQRELIEQLRISEEENNLAVALGGSIVMRYIVADKTLNISPTAASANGLPETIQNVPYEPVKQGMISPETTEAYIGFFEAILKGSKACSVLYQQRYFEDWRWMEAKSTTIFGDDGHPVKAVISLFDVTERLEKETIYKKWQQSLAEREPHTYSLFKCNLNRDTLISPPEGLLIDFKDSDNYTEIMREYINRCVFSEDRDAYSAFVNPEALLASYYRSHRADTLEYRELSAGDNTQRWLRLSIDLLEYPNSTDVEAYFMYEDIDEAKKAELQTKTLSETDALTGLLNRTAFTEKVDKILRGASRDDKYALLMLDIDGFKQVNDVFGHRTGDDALVSIAESLRNMMRREDLVARLGGDEFVIFLNGVSDDAAVAAKAKQICSVTQRSFSAEVKITGSVGIVFAPRDGGDFAALYKKADAALYYVKGSGKNSYALYSDFMADEHLEPETDADNTEQLGLADKRRRMLIVEDNVVDYAMLQNIFKDEFLIEKASDGNTALIRLRHYGSAISVVLLDLIMPGMSGFSVLEKMRENPELRSVPVVIVSGDGTRESCLEAIRKGAADFITKPVDPETLYQRVRSAVSKGENDRLQTLNSFMELQRDDRIKYVSALENTGVTFVEYNWINGTFSYYPSVAKYLTGTYDGRKFWRILLSDMVADTQTVQNMQKLVHEVASDRGRMSANTLVKLRTPLNVLHSFRMNVHKFVNEYRLTDKIIITLLDLDYDARKPDGEEE